MPLSQTASQIGKRLRDAREAAGLTQKAAADSVSIDSVTLSRWERGVQPPRMEKVAELAALFGVTVGELMGERLGVKVPRGTPAEAATTREASNGSDLSGPRHLRNLPLEIRVYLDELRLKLTKGGATEEEVDRAMALLRRPSIFSWYSSGTPKDLSPAKILQTMKAITESAILPYLREQGRKV